MKPNQELNALFVREEDSDADLGKIAQIETVAIRRNIGGNWASIPVPYESEDLDSEEKLNAIVGPGTYELRGLSAKKTIIRKIRITLADWGGNEPEPPAATEQKPPTPPNPAEYGASPVERMMLVMQQQSNQQFIAMMQMNQAQMGSMTQLLGVVLTNKSDGGMTDLVGKLIENRNSTNPENMFLAGIKTVADLQEGKREAEAESKADGGIGETMKVVAQAFEMYRTFTAAGTPVDEAQNQAIAGAMGGGL